MHELIQNKRKKHTCPAFKTSAINLVPLTMSLTVTGLLSPEFRSKIIASIVILVSNGIHRPATKKIFRFAKTKEKPSSK
jgi:hypothetical protein